MSEKQHNPEFDLAVSCSRWPRSDAADEQTRAMATGGSIDWDRFLRLVRRHRVEGLVVAAFARAGIVTPDHVSQALGAAARDIARQNLVYTAESARLSRMFAEAETPILFLKGLPLAIAAYGTLAVKKAWDVDILVLPEAASAAAVLLGEAGYERVLPPPSYSERQVRLWFELSKETLWRHPQRGVHVELHTRLTDNALLLPGLSAASPSEEVELASGISVATLRRPELFSYLCVHGAAHSWSRLKWLADVAALINGDSPEELDRLYRQSLEIGAGRCSGQALTLCSMLFGTRLSADLEEELRRDRLTMWLVRTALRVLAGRGSEQELNETALGTLPILMGHFAMGRGWRYFLQELKLKAGNPADQAALSLPATLRFLFPLLAVPAWMWRRLKMRQAG